MLWEELSWPKHEKTVAAGATVVMPFAAIEQHGPHNPVVVDTCLSTSVCQKAVDGMENVLLTPTMWAGLSPHHMEFSGTLTLSLETYLAVIQDLVRSVARHGYKKVLLVNGHGGNVASLQAAALSLKHELGITIWMVTYFRLGNEIAEKIRHGEIGSMGHSGEFETSMMLHLRPDLVDMEAAEKQVWKRAHPLMTQDMHRGGLLNAPADFTRDTKPLGVSGDPSVATAENGEKFYEATAERLRDIIQSLASL
ncbi:MAG: creatininase family protein [Nitrospinota bacterium]